MKKMLSLLVVFVLSVTMLAGIVSAEEFVPSITYKDGPTVEDAVLKDEKIDNCIVVTSILAAKEKTTDIKQETRDLLLDTYSKLSANTLDIPMPERYVIRELVDVSFKQTPCVTGGHKHEEELKKQENDVTLDFKLGVRAETDVLAYHYHEGKWEPVKSVKNNGDGTVTVVMEHFCPVAFCVDPADESGPAQTGDEKGNEMILWIILLVLSLAVNIALVVFLFLRMKKKRK